MDRGTWRATIHGVAKSQIWLKQLSMHTLLLKTDTQFLKTQGFLSYRISHILDLSGGFIVILTCSFMSFISHELNSAIRLDYIPVKYFWPEPMLGNPGCSVAPRACFLMRRKAIFGSHWGIGSWITPLSYCLLSFPSLILVSWVSLRRNS